MNNNFLLVNGDTDSIAFKKRDEKPFTPEEQETILEQINSLMPQHIVWKNDKYYRRFIVCAAKNYILDDGKKVTIKGSGLKATKKEPALREFIKEVCHLLLKDRKDQIFLLYLSYVKKIMKLEDISQWCFKATVTKKVLEPSTTFNQKIRTAIGTRSVSEGDKVYLYFRQDGTLSLREDFKGDCDKIVLLGKLRDTVEVFSSVFDTELFPDLTLARNKGLVDEILHDRL